MKEIIVGILIVIAITVTIFIWVPSLTGGPEEENDFGISMYWSNAKPISVLAFKVQETNAFFELKNQESEIITILKFQINGHDAPTTNISIGPKSTKLVEIETGFICPKDQQFEFGLTFVYDLGYGNETQVGEESFKGVCS